MPILPGLLLALCTAQARPLPNLPLPTLGGLQFWGDRFWDDGWRIQEHAWTGHCRLIDPHQVRRAWGGYDACLTAWRGLAPDAAPADRVIVVLHGLGRTRHAMGRLARALSADGDAVALLSWPTTRDGMAEHTRRLRGLLASLRARRVAFVTHSLGALAVRHALAAPAAERAAWPAVEGVVMLFPPNRGARAADIGLRIPPVGRLLGPGLRTAATAAADAVPPLTDPGLVIAGARGDGRGWNPLLPGDDDGLVRVAETSLPGVRTVLLRAIHTTGMDDPAVRAEVRTALAAFAAAR